MRLRAILIITILLTLGAGAGTAVAAGASKELRPQIQQQQEIQQPPTRRAPILNPFIKKRTKQMYLKNKNRLRLLQRRLNQLRRSKTK